MDFEIFLEVARRLDERRVDYVVVGGVAMNLQGIARATVDIDLFVHPSRDNVERLKLALDDVWHDPEIDGISPEDLAGDYPAVRYGPPEGDVTLDILTRLGEAFRFEEIEAETIDVEGVPVRVATPRMLYRMKHDTVRPIDRADAEALRDQYGLEEE